jgi:hypothetical protein
MFEYLVRPRQMGEILLSLAIVTLLGTAACSMKRVRVADEAAVEEGTLGEDSVPANRSTVMKGLEHELREIAADFGCTIQIRKQESGRFRKNGAAPDEEDGEPGSEAGTRYETRSAVLQLDQPDADEMDKLVQQVENRLARYVGNQGARPQPFEEKLKHDHIFSFRFDYMLPGKNGGRVLGQVDPRETSGRLEVRIDEW